MNEANDSTLLSSVIYLRKKVPFCKFPGSQFSPSGIWNMWTKIRIEHWRIDINKGTGVLEKNLCQYILSTTDLTKTGLGWTRTSCKGGSRQLTAWSYQRTVCIRAQMACLDLPQVFFMVHVPYYTSNMLTSPHFGYYEKIYKSNCTENAVSNKKWANYRAISTVIFGSAKHKSLNHRSY